MASYRRILVSARRNADRRLLAERRAAGGLVASRPGRAAISRKGIGMAGGPKVAILGAGSVGCFIGGAWAAAGIDVTFIGRPNLSKDLDQYVLTLTDYDGWKAHLAPCDIDYRSVP